MTANGKAAKNGKAMNKSEFVRQFPASVHRSEVVAKAKERGMHLTENYVSSIRTAAKKTGGTPKRGRPRAAAVPAARKAATAAPPGDTDRQFLSLVLELGLRRSEALLASVKAQAAQLV